MPIEASNALNDSLNAQAQNAIKTEVAEPAKVEPAKIELSDMCSIWLTVGVTVFIVQLVGGILFLAYRGELVDFFRTAFNKLFKKEKKDVNAN